MIGGGRRGRTPAAHASAKAAATERRAQAGPLRSPREPRLRHPGREWRTKWRRSSRSPPVGPRPTGRRRTLRCPRHGRRRRRGDDGSERPLPARPRVGAGGGRCEVGEGDDGHNRTKLWSCAVVVMRCSTQIQLSPSISFATDWLLVVQSSDDARTPS